MSEHCKIVALSFCHFCGKFTLHLMESRNVRRCLEHQPTYYTKKQLEDRQRREREAKQGDLFA